MRGRRLGRTSSHRKALARNLMTSLFLHGRIVTTEVKAKEYRGQAEKLITLGRQKTLHRVRQAVAVLRSREAVSRLFDEIGPSFVDRPGGYTRIVKLPKPRLGDKGRRVYLELVNYVPPKVEAAPAAAGRKGKRADEAADSDEGPATGT
jgi:large subunit ribosomal protein L17